MSGWAAAAQIGSDLLQGYFQDENTEDINHANEQMAERNIQMQKEFAQQGIRWKVEDAKMAGLHPLAALGAQTTSFTPVSVGYSPKTGMAEAFGNIGQNLARAIHAQQTEEERSADAAQALARQKMLDEINLEAHKAQLQQMQQQNVINAEAHAANMRKNDAEIAYMASQMKRLQTQSNPPMPNSVSTPESRVMTGKTRIKPSESISAKSGQPALEAADTPGFKRFRMGGPQSGGHVELPNQLMSEALDSMSWLAPFYVFGHNISRSLDNVWHGPGKPPAGPGYDWRWNRWRQQYEAYKK